MVETSEIILAKSSGLDLSSHTNSVLNTAYSLNSLGKYGLDKRILKYASIFHDLGKANPLFQENMKNNDFRRVCRHEVSSILFIKGVPEDIRDIVAWIILSHHKSLSGESRSFIDRMDCDDTFMQNHIGNISEWGKVVKDYLSDYYNIEISVPTVSECENTLNYYYDKYFDLGNGYSEYRGIFMMADHLASCFENDSERILILKNLFSVLPVSKYGLKDKRYPLSLIDGDKSKRHTFVIAPTGSGKTNFMMKRCTKRIFYTLPFSASINAMYQRLSDGEDTETYKFGLKHASMANLDFLTEESKSLSNLFGLSLKVCTPFQLMDVLFRAKGYEINIMDIKGQDVILDEIHTYSDLNLTAVVEMVRQLVALGCNVHICTATIPTILKNKLLEILGEENTQIVEFSKVELKTFNRHIIHTRDSLDVYDAIRRYNNGEKVLIVSNTVNRAQAIYKLIKKTSNSAKILLLHSRYERKRKNEIENLLMTWNRSDEPCIVVATQVVEVSLDINFDVMYTDVADIMSLIQRFGRINRQRNIIGLLKDIYVCNVSSYLPYKEDVCKRTFEELKKYDGMVLPESDIQDIIDRVHPEYDGKIADFSPLTQDGLWKTKLFCNCSRSSISESLKIVGYTAILRSKVDYYLKTGDSGVEIPVAYLKINRKNLVPKYKEGHEGNKDYILFYIVEDDHYSEELGVF